MRFDIEKFKIKLTSRKFWALIASVISGVLMAFGFADSTIEIVAGAVMIVGPAIVYMVVEYKLDRERLLTSVEAILDAVEAVRDDEATKELIKERLEKL
jgi:hypothetical protein